MSDLFTGKWFGSVDADSHVQDGRWAHADSFSYSGGLLQNSYGMIRAPWNNNPDTELTRHMFDVCGLEPLNKPIPTCQVHAAVINSTNLAHVQSTIAGWGHGTLHVNTGGVFGGCTGAMTDFYRRQRAVLRQNVSMASLSEGIRERFGVDPGWRTEDEFPLEDFVVDAFHLEYFHIYRTLWRSQTCAADGQPLALECPTHCDPSVPAEECKCQCRGVSDPATFDWQNIEPCLYMQNKTRWIAQTALPEETRRDLVTTFCSASVKEGDQLESASPTDIVFWMIHPVLDRLLAAKRLAALTDVRMGSYGKVVPFEDESWLSFSSYSTKTYTCLGHGADDEALAGLTILKAVAEKADVDGDGKISNIELYKAMDPSMFTVDYVFDDYKWDHCGDSAQSSDFTATELMQIHTESYASSTHRASRRRPNLNILKN